MTYPDLEVNSTKVKIKTGTKYFTVDFVLSYKTVTNNLIY